MSFDNALFETLVRLGDNGLILSQRLGEWCGHGPVLEEDIALTNVALDLLGQARFWLTYAGELEGAGRDEDAMAFLREEREYRNLILVEQPNGDFGDTIARQFYFDSWHLLTLAELKQSGDARIAGIAEKSHKEVKYHLQRSTDWIIRLGDGTEESHRRIQDSLNAMWMFTGEMFEMDDVDREMLDRGIGPDYAALKAPWLAHVTNTLTEATLTLPTGKWMQSGGRRGKHSEHLGFILAELQHMQRTFPGAKW